jgi:CHASE2 domain-containing sensor protein
LIQIDEQTLENKAINNPDPINQELLAEIVQELTNLKANIIGIDYILNRPEENGSLRLNQAIKKAVEKHTWLTFLTTFDRGEWLSVSPEIASLEWSLEGEAWISFWHISQANLSEKYPLPFSHQLAISYAVNTYPSQGGISTPKPNLKSQASFQKDVSAFLRQQDEIRLPDRAYLKSITSFSYLFHQIWFQPLIDFSIPPEQVYKTVSAWDLIESPEVALQKLGRKNLEDVVVIIVPGGYREAGLTDGEDNFPAPPAIKYWNDAYSLTGGETHAYLVHHLINERLVMPVPTIGIILIAALAGKAILIGLSRNRLSNSRWILFSLSITTVTYGILSLQLYISAAVMVPWLLPVLTLWTYIFLHYQEKVND